MFVFAYGSLLFPDSLRGTLPTLSWRDCVPARLHGHRREFGVAFPNDGSQRDKAYVDADGARPPVVLFANVYRAGPAESVNGVCVPVDDDLLSTLAGRELRYDTVDVSEAVRSYPAAADVGTVVAFVGKRRFTREADVADGVVPEGYAATIADGARFWDEHHPGFLDDFLASTDWPAPESVQPLTRIDLAPPTSRDTRPPR